MVKLQIMNGPIKGQSFDLEKAVYTIGRSPDNDIQIMDNTISRNHLKIFKKKRGFFVKDLKSKNGTFVNGERVQAGAEIEVKAGMPLAIGRVFIHLNENYTDEASADRDLEALNSIDLSKELGSPSAELVRDRPNTPQKNMGLIAQVNDVLREALGINEILEKMLNHILDFFTRIDRGFFILFDQETGEISQIIKVFNTDEDKVPSRYSRTIVERVKQNKKPVLMLDTLAEESNELSESMRLMKIKSVMCVPLISRSKIKGVIYVDTINEPNGFRKDDLSLLTALSSPTAVVIESALLSMTKAKEKPQSS